ncbi:hypothetical protein GCM10029964_015070 [Kibdelosporangium lantanae]
MRETHRVRGVRGQRGALRCGTVCVRVVTGVPVATQQREHLHPGDTARNQGDTVTVGGEQPVLRPERECRAHLARFLAGGRGVDGQPALLGQSSGLPVEPAPEDHAPVQGAEHPLVGQVTHGGAGFVDQLDRLLAW